MTKEEADRRIAEAKERVIKAARVVKGAADATLNECAQYVLADALNELEAAESAREALERPRLKTASEVWSEAKGAGHPEGWRAVSRKTRGIVIADILTQAEKLPRVHIDFGERTWTISPARPTDAGVAIPAAILLSDLKALINGEGG